MEEVESPKDLPTFSTEDLQSFKNDLLAIVYNQTITQLELYQRGKCFKATVNTKTKQKSSLLGLGNEAMPSEAILNDIKLGKELDGLRNIYEIAYKQLTAQIIEKTQLDSVSEETKVSDTPHDILISAIESRKPENNKVDILQREVKEKKAILSQLREQLKAEKLKAEQQISDREQRLQSLRDQMKNQKRISELEFRLVDKWEANRLSQATIMGEIAERSLLKQIVELNRRTAGEKRLICEVEAFRKNQIADLQQQISDWKQKYKDENIKMLAKNFELSERIADLSKSHEKHFEINEKRKAFVAIYRKEKAEERRLYEEQMFRIECAVRIQAWWRGTMVRRGLGPYRKKAKKGKKAKGKK